MSRPSLLAFVAESLSRKERRAPSLTEPALWFSMLGKACVRELFYQATGAPRAAETSQGLIRMGVGSAFDSHALRPQSSPYAVAVQVPVRVEPPGLGIAVTGRADAVWLDGPRAVHVSDLKVVGDSTWEKTKRAPKAEHVAQANAYACALDAPTWSVGYVRASTGEGREHYGEADAFAARRDLAALEDVVYWIRKGEAPPRPYSDEEDEENGEVKRARDAFPCAWCPYRATCWPEESAT